MTGPASTVPGPQGERGFNGTQGIQGLRGFNGTDGVNGTQGIQGLRGFNGTDGVNGTQGLQGPAGINVINASNYYSVQGDTGVVPFGNPRAFSSAFCDTGDVAISGGYIISPITITPTPGSFDIEVDIGIDEFGSATFPADPPVGWATTIIAVEGTAVTTTVYCFDNPPLR